MEKTKEVLTTATYLKEATFFFAARFLDLHLNDFKC